MNNIKLLVQRLMAKAFDQHITELQIRAAIFNRFTALGTPTTTRVAQIASASGEAYSSTELYNTASVNSNQIADI